MTGKAGHPVVDLVETARNRRAPIDQRHAAYSRLIERFEGMAFTTALQVCGDVESARDACQEAFLVAWRKLPNLRQPAAFGGWLKRLIRTQAARARRRLSASAGVANLEDDASEVREPSSDPEELLSQRDLQRWVLRAVEQLPAPEREAILLFYFLGESLDGVARVLGTTVGNAGKRVYTARLRLRRTLPRSVTELFLAMAPAPAFAQRVEAGVLDEFVGEYRFPNRPDHRILIRREGNVLASYAGGQRNILAGRRPDTLVATEFDGEGRFGRDRKGHISHFVYYEFGRRLGVAQKVGDSLPV